MRGHLRNLHKALKAADAVHGAYVSGMETLNSDLEKCHKGVSGLAGHDPVVAGHLGRLRKCAALHDNAVKLAKGTHDALQLAGANALAAISRQVGVGYETMNPNADLANGRGSGTDISDPGERENLPTHLTTSDHADVVNDPTNTTHQKAMTTWELEKALSNAHRTRTVTMQRLNKNAAGNPHFKNRPEYPVPDLSVGLSNKY
jgi:hypothetical protein